METNLNLSLINGVYSSEEAKEILMNVFASKIQFHELKNLLKYLPKTHVNFIVNTENHNSFSSSGKNS